MSKIKTERIAVTTSNESTQRLTPGAVLRKMIAEAPPEDPVAMAGCYDGLSARLAEEAGFSALCISGASMALTLGYPDLGLVTLAEVARQTYYITGATRLPVVVDGDAGYGNALNVDRLIRMMERSGAAGVHFEDQPTPKRCPRFTEGKKTNLELLSLEEAVGKVKAAVRARTDPDFLIIARTDAGEMGGVTEAVRRSRAFLEAGADVVSATHLKGSDEFAEYASEIEGMKQGYITNGYPVQDRAQLGKMGYNLIAYPTLPIMTASAALRGIYGRMARGGELEKKLYDDAIHLFELFDLMGAQRYLELEAELVPKR